MNLLEVREKTVLKVVFEGRAEIQAEFHDAITPINFSIFCPEIAQDIERYKGTAFTIKFFAWNSNQYFTGKIAGVKPGNNDIVSCIATSLIEELSNRANIRISVSVKVKVHTYVESAKNHLGQLLCEGTSDDISKGGIRFWSDYYLDMPFNTMFTLELLPLPSSDYIFPAKMIRRQQNTSTRTYNYDYGFVFLPQFEEQKEKLILDIMQTGIRSRR